MDTTKTIYKPPIHEHPLFLSARFRCEEYWRSTTLPCNACNGREFMYGGYFCNEYDCNIWFFHKECAEAPLEINNPSHPQHPLLLTYNSGDGPCQLCGQDLYPSCYSCSTCEFKVDLTCGMRPSPPAIEHPLCHDHPLTFLKKRDEEPPCEVCKESIDGPSYSCLGCNNVYFHVGCVHFSKEVNHPCHSNHPLKLLAPEALTDGAEKICLSCGQQPKRVLYHCSICNFSMCLVCTRNPPPFVIEHIKTHKHPLTCFFRRISYTCDACGLEGNMRPYICLQCGFVIHGYCIDLPRVININRHDHRILFTHHLGAGYSKCGVCRKSLSQYHGAYHCSVCPNYATHSQCATRFGIWDRVELEGIPDDTKYIAPFKVVGDDLIRHFSHDKHTLKLRKNNILYSVQWLQCEACSHPVGFDSIYDCEECGFVLHEKCANLPMKKRLIFDTIPYTLDFDIGILNCSLCRTLSHAPLYISHDNLARDVDVHCGSLSEPLVHDGHLHPLYYHENDGHYCDGCHCNVNSYVFRCDACDFYLCFYCACLPEKVWHINDEHPLTLYCGEKANGNNWCDNCENELDPCKWFYRCSDCGVSLHARCVLGDFSRLKLGYFIEYGTEKFMVVPNNHSTRPLCIQCHSRCKFPVILKRRNEDNGYICSRSCLMSFMK